MQVIESYPNIRRAYIEMELDNGGINRDRTEEMALRESDPVIGAEGVDHSDLVAIDQWLGTLSEEEIQTFVSGEHSEMEDLVARGGEVGQKASGLFNDLFDGEPSGETQ